MSNVNNYAFAKQMDQFKAKILDPQTKRVADAEKIMHDNNYKWDSEDAKKAGQSKYDSYKQWLTFYQELYDGGVKVCSQHETLVNKMSKIYDSWYNNISNDGRQETEIMTSQADMLCELMGELYKELLPLKLEGMKPPHGINL